MKAVIIESFGDLDKIKISDTEVPEPLEGEVQIEVHHAGVNPVEWKITAGILKDRMPHIFPLILGWDVAGIISKVGKGVKNLKKGDEVFAYCRKPVVQSGTFAEFVCFTAEHVAKKPKNISFTEAATIPLVGLTAWQALFDLAHLERGQTILIHAGAGGVGGMAIQFAKVAGAKVFTTASHSNHAYVKKLGADEAIDYKQQDFAVRIKKAVPKGVDLVLDCVGGETLYHSYDCVKKGGWIVSIVESIDQEIARKKGFNPGYVFVRPNGEELKKIADLIESGEVVSPEVQEVPMKHIIQALRQIQTEHTRGKISLKIK